MECDVWRRVTSTNGSGETKFELADLQLTNLMPGCKYKHVLGRFDEVKDKFDRDVMLRCGPDATTLHSQLASTLTEYTRATAFQWAASPSASTLRSTRWHSTWS